MKRVLITGISGTGKSSVVIELRARGYRAIDFDYEGWTELADVPNPGPLAPEPGKDWLWREDRVARLLATDDAPILFIAGAAPNQRKFYDRFEHVVLLSAPASVITERLATRTNNPYGKRPGELERVLALKERIEPLLRSGADVEIDTDDPLDAVVDRILRAVR